MNRTVSAPRAVLRPARHRRSGIATIWLIIAGPALFTLLCFAADVANLWLARVELETALESAALAGAKHWGDNNYPDSQPARQMAVYYAAANTVVGVPLVITENYSAGGGQNQNDAEDGSLIFGRVTTSTSPYDVNAGLVGSCASGSFGGAVIAQKQQSVNSLVSSLFGVPVGPYSVQVRVTARYNCATSRPELIRLGTLIFPGP